MDYSGVVDVWARPFRGGHRRDVLVHIVARTRWANALLPAVAESNTGKVTTTAFAFGNSVSLPMRLGWSFNAGVDLEFVSMHIDPQPLRGDPLGTFRALLTLGIVAASSSDPARLLPRDPLSPPADGRVAGPRRAVRRSDSATALDQGSFDDEADENED